MRGAELDVFGPDVRAVPAGEEGVGVLAHLVCFFVLLLVGGGWMGLFGLWGRAIGVDSAVRKMAAAVIGFLGCLVEGRRWWWQFCVFCGGF